MTMQPTRRPETSTSARKDGSRPVCLPHFRSALVLDRSEPHYIFIRTQRRKRQPCAGAGVPARIAIVEARKQMNDNGRVNPASLRSPGKSGPSKKPRANDDMPVDAAEFAREMAEIAEKSQRLVADFLNRQTAKRASAWRPDGDRRRVFRDDRADDGRPGAADRGADVAVERLYDAVAAHRAALSRRRGRAGDRAGARATAASATARGATTRSSTSSSRATC